MSLDNSIRVVNGSPITEAELNTEITNQNTNGRWITDIKFASEDLALITAVKTQGIAGWTSTQHVNQFTGPNQAILDADAFTEEADQFYPTGVFTSPNGTVFVLYQYLGLVMP